MVYQTKSLTSKTGSDTTTTWNFERGEEFSFTKKELENIIPESLQEYEDYYDIVEAQILPSEHEDTETDYEEDEDDEDVSRGVVGLSEEEDEVEEEEEDVRPRRRTRIRKVRNRRRKQEILYETRNKRCS